MSKIYQILLLVCMLFSSLSLSAQRYVKIPGDPTGIVDIFPVITGDTTATGERVDSNTIYQLENGEVYVTTDRIVNKPGWILHIEAEDLEDTANKPTLTTIPNASNNYPNLMRPEGNLTLVNLFLIPGERGPAVNHGWGNLRIMGDNARVIVTDCIIDKDRGGFIQLRGDSAKVYITNCVFRNGGNRRVIQGNGRGFDARDTSVDTLILRQTVIHNIQDRFFRSQGGKAPHNYIEIDNCTSFNTAGRHGFIQLGQVITAKITDNLFINPLMMGTSPIYTDEQNQPDSAQHKVITIDTLFENTSLTISNNNIFWTQDVTDYWASNDSVSAPPVLSDLILQHLGDAANQAFFQEEVTLDNAPTSILPYVVDLYADPANEDMWDFIVESPSYVLAIPEEQQPYENVFDFTAFSPCYGSDTQSATGSSTGGPVGATFLCAGLATSVFTPDVNSTLALQVFPNPVTQRTNFQFELKKAGLVQLNVRDISGRVIATPISERLTEGQHVQSWQIPTELAKGLYLVTLATEEGIMTQKLMVQ